MALIQVTPDLLTAKASELRNLKAEHDETMSKMKTLIYGLNDVWKGDAQDAYVAKYDSNAKKSFADYPAYDYAVNYGTENNFKKFEKGWYLPTAAEARMLAKSNIPDLPDFIWTASQSYVHGKT